MACSGCGGMEVLRVSDRQQIPVESMVKEVKGARLTFVGEVHTEEAHHDLQLKVLMAAREQGGELALACEMFTAASQSLLDLWFDGAMDHESFENLYRQDWRNTPYGLYEDIFSFARQNRIRVIGLNVRREIIQKVARSGCDSLSAEERKELPEGVRCEVSPQFRQFMERVFAKHPLSDRSFENFCEAQALWNSSMARVLEGFIATSPDTRVVVVIGGGHALRQVGVPGHLSPRLALEARIIIPEINGIDEGNVTPELADYLLLEGNNPLLGLLLGE
jgi:uncharacterized iron-regulated protein